MIQVRHGASYNVPLSVGIPALIQNEMQQFRTILGRCHSCAWHLLLTMQARFTMTGAAVAHKHRKQAGAAEPCLLLIACCGGAERGQEGSEAEVLSTRTVSLPRQLSASPEG